MKPRQSLLLATEPVPQAVDELALGRGAGLSRVARVQVPLTLTVRPWATLYRLPDGARIWCLRLPSGGEVRSRCVRTGTLLRYARSSGLVELEDELAEALARAEALDALFR